MADTKLARRVKPYFLLQLCFYSELVAAIQGIAPQLMHVVLGTRDTEAFKVAEFAAYYRAVKQRFESVIDSALAGSYPEPVEHCQLCRWEEHCATQRDTDEHLSLVARIQRSQRSRLIEHGIDRLPARRRGAGKPLTPDRDGHVRDATRAGTVAADPAHDGTAAL